MARSRGRRRLVPANRRMMAATSVPTSTTYRTYPGRVLKPAPGSCRWCGVWILDRQGEIDFRRTFCGQQCVTNYLLRADPAVMRRHVFFRDRGVCGMCGFQHLSLKSKEWQADHIEPLMLAQVDKDPRYWEPDNVQVLCTRPCHQIKSADDMKRFAWVLELAKGPAEPAPKRVKLADRLT
jgi:5-methylcytosine-specific restriction endonuclease McrA